MQQVNIYLFKIFKMRPNITNLLYIINLQSSHLTKILTRRSFKDLEKLIKHKSTSYKGKEVLNIDKGR
jgi:hypothetical protein